MVKWNCSTNPVGSCKKVHIQNSEGKTWKWCACLFVRRFPTDFYFLRISVSSKISPYSHFRQKGQKSIFYRTEIVKLKKNVHAYNLSACMSSAQIFFCWTNWWCHRTQRETVWWFPRHMSQSKVSIVARRNQGLWNNNLIRFFFSRDHPRAVGPHHWCLKAEFKKNKEIMCFLQNRLQLSTFRLVSDVPKWSYRHAHARPLVWQPKNLCGTHPRSLASAN